MTTFVLEKVERVDVGHFENGSTTVETLRKSFLAVCATFRANKVARFRFFCLSKNDEAAVYKDVRSPESAAKTTKR